MARPFDDDTLVFEHPQGREHPQGHEHPLHPGAPEVPEHEPHVLNPTAVEHISDNALAHLPDWFVV